MASAAPAKEMLRRAVTCGASGCSVESRNHLSWNLLPPLIESGREAPAPPASSERYRITLSTSRGRPRDSRIVVDYLPRPGYLRVHGRRGRCGEVCPTVPRRWVVLDFAEAAAYRALTEGLAPFGAPERSAESGRAAAESESAASGVPGPLLPVVATTLVLGGLLLVVRRRRIAARTRPADRS